MNEVPRPRRNVDSVHRPGARRALATACVLVGLGLFAGSYQASAATLDRVDNFGSNPGNLQMFTYIPEDLPASAPVVVAMHGCTQTAQAYADGAGWPKYADLYGFALIFPQQRAGNNRQRCFNWFKPGDINRGQGEALSIRQMVDRVKSTQQSDPARIYVTGLSAGGAMTNVMLATYPDVFAGGAVMSGLAYKCATSLPQATTCQYSPVNKTPAHWGDLVRNAARGFKGPWPIVSIWHGDADYIVRPVNQAEQMAQWTNVHGIDQTADRVDTVNGATYKAYENVRGDVVVETYSIPGMGHGVAVDPGMAAAQCGAAGAYILDVDICSSYYALEFWGIAGDDDGDSGGDTEAPAVNLTSPNDGATVTGRVDVTASASDNVGVTWVEFYVDDNLKASDTAAPFSFRLETTTLSNGAHALKAKAHDAAGNAATDDDTAVTVSNSGGSEFYCGTASNYAHVQAARAYRSGGYAHATGSGQRMGLYNVFYTSTLQETGADYYVITASCP